MAKKPKVRKKSTGIDFGRRSMATIVDHCYFRLKFMGDCFNPPVALGVQKIWTHLIGRYHEEGLSLLVGHLERDMDWSVTLSCYFKKDAELEELEVVQSVIVFRDCNIKEVSANLSSVICETILNVLSEDRYSEDELIYYVYTANPEFNKTHFNMSDALSDVISNIIDFTKHEPFGATIPGISTDENSLTLAIRNNRLWPKVKEIKYYNVKEEMLHEDDDFLIPDPEKR